MTDLDEVDLEILRLLLDDARRPYSEIAAQLDVSGPTVSDRVDRLKAEGVINRFTIDLSREHLVEGISLLIEIHTEPGTGEELLDNLLDIGAIEHGLQTADGRVLLHGRLDPQRARSVIEENIDLSVVTDLSITIAEDVRWSPEIQATGFATACAQCGNTVTSEGRSTVIDDERYHFCCPSCEERFVERYTELAEDVSAAT